MAKRVTEYEEHGFMHGRECRPFPWPNNEEHGWTHGKEHRFLPSLLGSGGRVQAAAGVLGSERERF